MMRLLVAALVACALPPPLVGTSTAGVKMCYAYFGFVSDLGFTYSQNLGRAWVDAEVQTVSQYVEGVGFMARADQEVVMNSFVNDDCQIIVTGSDLMQGLAMDYADAYPHIRFICLTCWNLAHKPNMAAIDVLIHEAGYVAGIVAASQVGVERIGYVASNYVSASFRNLNSFALGALSVRPNASLFLTHAGSWFDPRTESIAGKRLVEQHGVDLLAYDSDSTAIVATAREMGKLSIAIKVDGTAAYGETNLMSRIMQWNDPLLETVKAAINITNWTQHRNDNAEVGFREDAVSLGTFSSAVSTTARIAALQQRERFVQQGDITFCPGSQGIQAFCPPDAALPSPELGGLEPIVIYPCDLPGGVVYPEDGDCLSSVQQRVMSWVVSAYHDLGRVSIPAECPTGTRLDYSGPDLCLNCTAGTVTFQTDQEACEPCVQGRFEVNGVECRRCPPGSFSSTEGSSECTQCPPGTAARQEGQTACTPCEEGTFSNVPGQMRCERCPVGTFRDAPMGVNCTPCERGETTELGAATSAAECVCPDGKYRDSPGVCQSCPTGMQCSRGSDVRNFPSGGVSTCVTESCAFPQTEPKYMTLPSEPLKVYKCLTDEACPGAASLMLETSVSTCGPHRSADEVACGLCESDAFLNKDGDCEACSGGPEILTFFVVIVAGIAGVAAMAFIVNRDLLLQRNGMVSVIILGGVFVTAVQTTVVFNQLSLEWVEPMKSAMQVASLFTFDLTNLKTACYLPVNPVSKFLGRQIVAPCCLPVLALAVLSKKCRGKTFQVGMLAEIGNAAGTIFSVFFISVVTASVDPFVCYPHPADSGSGDSMLAEPAVLCWDDDRHMRMIIISIVSFLLVPALFFGVCVYAIVQYPKFMSVNDDRQRWWLHTFRFLFFRFAPRAYTYGVLLLLRNLIICLVPAVFPGDTIGIQVLLLASLLLAFGFFQATWRPWRTHLANKIDSLTSAVLIMILLCGAMLTEVNIDSTDISIVSTCVLLVGLLGLGVGAGVGLRESLWPGVRYHHFLCHHKAFAAAQARYMQTLINLQLRRSCFLDSDDLTHLGKLFDVVKTAVSHFLVYLTRETLTRPWCAGEVVMAKESKLTVTKIVHWSFVAPTEADLNNIDSYVAKGVNLMDYNIDNERIADAFRWISGQQVAAITLQASQVGTAIFYSAVSELGKLMQKPSKSSLPDGNDAMLISCDSYDLEAVAAGGILASRIQQEATAVLQGSMVLLADVAKDIDPTALRSCIALSRVVITLLTPKTLENLQQIQAIFLVKAGGVCDIPVRTPAFQFPDEHYYSNFLPKFLSGSCAAAAQTIRTFFEQIAVPLSTHASDSILQAEAFQIMSRVPMTAVTEPSKKVLGLVPPRAREDDSASAKDVAASPEVSAPPVADLDGTDDSGLAQLAYRWAEEV